MPTTGLAGVCVGGVVAPVRGGRADSWIVIAAAGEVEPLAVEAAAQAVHTFNVGVRGTDVTQLTWKR